MQIDVGILDFSKAFDKVSFDKVSYSKLVYKPEFYGITGNTLNWIKSFLCNRTQSVVVESSYSTPCSVTPGVPQGSVLGPVLFSTYINDIATDIHSQLRLFADDCLIYKTMRSVDDHHMLQEDLNTLASWATWNSTFPNVIYFKSQLIAIRVHLSTKLMTLHYS